jgi:hypothetical protein
VRVREREDIVDERGVSDTALWPDEREVGVQQKDTIHLP